MKGIYLIIIVWLVTSCGFQKNKRSESLLSSDSVEKTNSTNEHSENLTEMESNPEIIELPVIGTFELNNMKLDSLNKYGAGDCWGTIRRYSLPDVGLAIDSMNCGEYGYIYKYYLLSNKDFIQVVYTKKSESILNLEKNTYFYIQQEQVIDFNSDPAISMIKIDTVYEYNLRDNPINKKFVTTDLRDVQKIYNQLDNEYQGKWDMELDN